MILICGICLKEHEKSTGHYNRAVKIGANLYCSKSCFGLSRRKNKSKEQLKAEKSKYDKNRLAGSKRSEILKKKKEYHVRNREIINAKQRVYNKKRMPDHVLYCRRPDQREKERLRNRRKNGLTDLKKCLRCNKEKQKIEFENYLVFPDKRNSICKSCENEELIQLNITTREVLQNIRSALVKTKSNLKIRDIAKYPYLIESHKYLLLLKRLTK